MDRTKKWESIISHYRKLLDDVSEESSSDHHEQAAKDVVDKFCTNLTFHSVVELGCGTAPILDQMKIMGKKTCGVTLCNEPNRHKLIRKDMHFSGLADASYDLVAIRHALEHSPMPLLLLMEMRRIATKYALVVLPTLTDRAIWTWKNHYSVFDKSMWEKLFVASQWEISKYQKVKYFEYEPGKWDEEYRWLLRAIN